MQCFIYIISRILTDAGNSRGSKAFSGVCVSQCVSVCLCVRMIELKRLKLQSPYLPQARFPFKRNRLRCVRCVNENRKKRRRLRWQAANHGCHCFDRAFLLAGACVSCGFRLRNARNARNASDCV